MKEGYIVNLVLGGVIALTSIAMTALGRSNLKGYKHPQAQKIDEECNHKDAVWLDDYKLYLTNSFIVSTDGGIEAIDIGTVTEVKLTEVWENYKTVRKLVCRTRQKETLNLYVVPGTTMFVYQEDVENLKNIFSSRNIKFKCTLQIEEDDE